ncbi:glycoside hydrolase family 88 protein [Actinoplanes derwentensis]|uniref:Unsaturated chondroitin disaccharide hydrolase n=1 Tax=Actinoplanes derwentensis TaxID=113562 RepID=A0A1H1Z4X5_9ACTN|nr:glycoside hydrolase family 88 protein [Actinoplanes derwentensis]GID81432.1 glycosyl hydrolase [Actinoplanes derwentensis]SDT28720.1 unsaturated chondroitin disaccharide hydrolase [Actinoplanes derwentensis]
MTAIADQTGAAVTAALRTIDANIEAFGERYPADTTTDDRYSPRPANTGWTTSFWPGMLWVAHDLSGEEQHRKAALAHVRSFVDRVDHGIDLDTHDLGFLYTLSCVTAWRRTRDPEAERAALSAADHLLRRVLPSAGIIQAWGDLADPRQQGRTIVDSLMNTPLLFWASRTSGDPKYAAAARRHAAQLREHLLRPDDTTYHTFYWDPATGEPLRGETEQGSGDESCWARGQAWGIYGFTLNHQYTGDPTLLAAAIRCADYFLAHLPADGVAHWDLIFAASGVDEERDSSAAAIAVNGLLELAPLVAPALGTRYRDAALRILHSLIEGYSTVSRPDSNALLLHGVYDKPKNVGVDEGNLWGDYFYMEALARVTRPGWKHPW